MKEKSGEQSQKHKDTTCAVKSTIRSACWLVGCFFSWVVELEWIEFVFRRLILRRFRCAFERLRVGCFRGLSTYTREAGFHYHVSGPNWARERGSRETIITGHPLPDENAPSISSKDILSVSVRPTLHSLTNIDMSRIPYCLLQEAGATFANLTRFPLLVPWPALRRQTDRQKERTKENEREGVLGWLQAYLLSTWHENAWLVNPSRMISSRLIWGVSLEGNSGVKSTT